jgi:hypothetical protein
MALLFHRAAGRPLRKKAKKNALRRTLTIGYARYSLSSSTDVRKLMAVDKYRALVEKTIPGKLCFSPLVSTLLSNQSLQFVLLSPQLLSNAVSKLCTE